MRDIAGYIFIGSLVVGLIAFYVFLFVPHGPPGRLYVRREYDGSRYELRRARLGGFDDVIDVYETKADAKRAREKHWPSFGLDA